MGQIYLEITDKASLIAFIAEAKKTGLLKDLSIQGVDRYLPEERFPVRVPIDICSIIKLAENPVIKKLFSKKIDTTFMSYLIKAIEAGR